MVWNQDEWRQPTPSERAQLHGLPPSLLEAIDHANQQQRTALRNSAVGNGFHIPCVMMAVLIMLQLAPPANATAQLRSLPDAAEQALHQRIRHTAFDPQVLEVYPGLLTTADILKCMQAQLPQLSPSHWAWTCTSSWKQEDLRTLQSFGVFSKWAATVAQNVALPGQCSAAELR